MGFTTPVPASAEEWERRKPSVRRTLRRLLGEWPPLFTASVEIRSRRRREHCTIEKFSFDNGIGHEVSGLLLIPNEARFPAPAILYHHQHADRYATGKRELLTRDHPQLGFATGVELARHGYVVLAIDAYAFEDRRWQGPAGRRESGAATEAALFKRFLWEGRTLWGMMVRDDLLALRYLLSRPEVDGARVAAMGMSMGSTRSWWAAALDERIRAVVSVACLTRYQDLLESGEVKRHGIYYFVPGLLHAQIDMETVIGLIAPRPHLTLTGDSDAGSPVAGVRKINTFQRKLYRLYGRANAFRGVIYPGVGHVYTPEMWRETIVWLGKHLGK